MNRETWRIHRDTSKRCEQRHGGYIEIHLNVVNRETWRIHRDTSKRCEQRHGGYIEIHLNVVNRDVESRKWELHGKINQTFQLYF